VLKKSCKGLIFDQSLLGSPPLRGELKGGVSRLEIRKSEYMIIFLLIIFVIAGSIVAFLLNEFRKKFFYMYQYVMKSDHLISLEFQGAEQLGRGPGMYTVVVKADAPFRALVGLFLTHPLTHEKKFFDHYGFIESHTDNIATFSTYLGKKPVHFGLLIDGANADTVKVSLDTKGEHTPFVSYPPHWWQRLL
jgi:hypothetical protein